MTTSQRLIEAVEEGFISAKDALIIAINRMGEKEVHDMCKNNIPQLFDVETESVMGVYENNECPDCGQPIPLDAQVGEACDNCGHVFYQLTENDDD
jgi:ribosomal protein S27AE